MAVVTAIIPSGLADDVAGTLKEVGATAVIVGDTAPGEGGDGQSAAVSAELRRARTRIASLERNERALHGGAEVAVVCWPAEEEHVHWLDTVGLPRLLVVETDADVVPPVHEFQRLIRTPITDIDARRELLQLRADAESRPVLDGTGRLHYHGRWVALSLTEERLARPLVRSFQDVVGYQELAKVGWLTGAPSENGRRLMMCRLRERCRDVDLEIVTIRGRGCLLSDSSTVSGKPRARRFASGVPRGAPR
jgi:hypothetical protein